MHCIPAQTFGDIQPQSSRWRPWRSPTLWLCAAAGLLPLFPSLNAAMQYDRAAITAGAYWRLVTGHLAHWNVEQFAWDVVVFALLGVLCERHSRARHAVGLTMAIIAISAAVWVLAPQLSYYRGLSGLDSALFGLLAVTVLTRQWRGRQWRSIAATSALLAGFVAKSTYEWLTADTLFVNAAAAGMTPVPLAHVVGAIAGAVVGMPWRMNRGAKTFSITSTQPAPRPRGIAARVCTADVAAARSTPWSMRLPCLIVAICTATSTACLAAAGPAGPASEVAAVFNAKCIACHSPQATGPAATRARRRLNDIGDLARVARDFVSPGRPDDSPLWDEVSDNTMPPAGAPTGPLTESQRAVIRRWILAGAPPTDHHDTAATPARPFVSDQDVIAAVMADLVKLDADQRRSARYLTLANLLNAGADDAQMRLYRNGLAKLINSLSWSPRIVGLQAIDPGATVYRLDLAELGWRASQWEQAADADPFVTAEIARRDRSLTEALALMTGTGRAIVRADRFAFVASRPPLYHDLLDLPQSDRELETLLGVDADADIQGGRAVRAAVVRSGVSQHNRVVERHATRYGAYWKSYDFRSSDGRQDVRSNPLGPGDGPRAFRHAGGEIIFNLPNGMQAYMLTTGATAQRPGQRIDAGPIEIVQDHTRADRIVVNGISCFSCHDGGLKPAADVVRDHALSDPQAFTAAELRRITELYAPKPTFAQYVQRDTQRFKRAVAAAGEAGGWESTSQKRVERDGGVEPVSALVERFEQPITSTAAAAAELGLRPRTWRLLVDQRDDVRDLQHRVEQPGGVPREQFATLVNRILRDGLPTRVVRRAGPVRLPLSVAPAPSADELEFWERR